MEIERKSRETVNSNFHEETRYDWMYVGRDHRGKRRITVVEDAEDIRNRYKSVPGYDSWKWNGSIICRGCAEWQGTFQHKGR